MLSILLISCVCVTCVSTPLSLCLCLCACVYIWCPHNMVCLHSCDHSDYMARAFEAAGVRTLVRSLPLGDMMWVATATAAAAAGAAGVEEEEEWVCPYIVERKTAADLRASISDARYKEQKYRLAVRSSEVQPWPRHAMPCHATHNNVNVNMVSAMVIRTACLCCVRACLPGCCVCLRVVCACACCVVRAPRTAAWLTSSI
jgi:hypothetical protein